MRKLSTIGKATCIGVALAALWGLHTLASVQVPDGCGNSVHSNIRFECGTIIRLNHDTATIRTEDGNEWQYTQNRTPWELWGYYGLQFDTKGTGVLYDDEIIKVWQEV